MPHQKRTTTGVLGGLVGLVGLSAVAGVLVTATVTPAIAVSGYAASSAIEVFENMPSYLEIDELMLPTEIYVKNADDEYTLLTEFYDQNRIPVDFDEVAPVMYDAILSSEDKNFYSHGGVDLMGTLSALVGNATSGSNRGASSITQQYVKNILQQKCELDAGGDTEKVLDCYNDTTVAKGAAGYQRKLQEMRYAIQLEDRYPKDEILNGYLNIAHFGGVVYGIGAAAEYYFGVEAKDLTIAQAATIAGMVQEPNTYRIDKPQVGTTTDKDGNPVNTAEDGYRLTKNRQLYVLGRMLQDGKITQAEHDEAADAPIEPNITNRPQGCDVATGAEYFCSTVVSIMQRDEAFGDEEHRSQALRRGGLKVYTTLDYDLQKAAREAISVVPKNVSYMELGASGIQLEVGTGRVLSMVQNTDYDPIGGTPGETPVNFNVRKDDGGGEGHSAGSTYKVFSLINWMEQGHSVNEFLNGRVGNKKVETCNGSTQSVPANNHGGIANFENNPGYTGTVYKFTVDSLNSGFFAMGEKISVCSTNEVAGRLGVTWGDGTPLTEVPAWSNDPPNLPYNVLGSSAVAPIDMAAAYAAIASNGILCQPKLIDKVVNSDGEEQPIPDTTCERVMSEAVASTAAYTLQGVMNGTGQGAKTYDGTPIFGKTGIHEYIHTWMDGASTEVATVVWVGNIIGNEELWRHAEHGWSLHRIRNAIWPEMQRAANAKYGGDAFPKPDPTLTKRTYVTLPSVIGMDEDAAVKTLKDAGFDVTVGDPVDGSEPEGTIIEQDPGAGRVAGGTSVTIRPSNGKGSTIPAVNGTPSDARSQLRSAGFSNIQLQCSETDGAPRQGVVTGTDPAAGTTTSRDTAITIKYQSENCRGGGDDDDDGGRG